MSFFLGIGGPWIVLVLLDLFWTKQRLELSPSSRSEGWQKRMQSLLQERGGRPVPLRIRATPRRGSSSETEALEPNSYLYRHVD